MCDPLLEDAKASWKGRCYMLTLSRQCYERIIITLPDNREIILAITSIEGKKVRLGFEAPKDIEIWREEVYKERHRREK